MYRFLMVMAITSAVGLQSWMALFNNYAVEVVGLQGKHIGLLQSIREIPGFLALLAVFIILFIREHRLSALSVTLLGVGIMATGLLPTFGGLIAATLVMSFGFHYYETTHQSLTLQYFDTATSPRVFGRLRSLAAASNIGACIAIYISARFLSFGQIYLIIGGGVMLLGLWGFSQDPRDRSVVPQRKKMIFRKKYWLYYFLTFMSGARRQIFMAFAVLLLVEKFQFSLQSIAILFLVNNTINFFLSPFIGKCIVLYGERRVLSLEYISLILIFIAYAAVESKTIVAGLYILDHVFFNFAIAIRTYFQKVGDPRDIAPSMAVGFTINHVAAVVLPVIGGIVWMIDYRIPFWAGAVMAIISLSAVQKMRFPAVAGRA